MNRDWINEKSDLSMNASEILDEWKKHPQLIVQCKAIDAFPDIGNGWIDVVNPQWTAEDLEFRFKAPGNLEVGCRYNFEARYDSICIGEEKPVYYFENVLVDSIDVISAIVYIVEGNRIYGDKSYPITKSFLPFYAIMNFTKIEAVNGK